jgi:MFS family permease
VVYFSYRWASRRIKCAQRLTYRQSVQEETVSTRGVTSLWRNADFNKLWAGQAISELGTYVTLIAIPFTAALTLHASPTQMGLLTFAGGVPTLSGLVAGVWVDRLRRRPLMLISDILRFFLLLVIPVTAALGWLRIELCYFVAFLAGLGTLFFDTAYSGYYTRVVGPAHLADGNSRLQATSAGASIVGPGFAGLLVQVLTAPFAMVADACSYLASVGFLLAIRTRESAPAPPRGRRNFRREIVEGWHALMRPPLLRAIVLYQATTAFFNYMRTALLVLFATRELGIGASIYGAANGIGGVGFLIGALLAGRIAARYGPGPTIIGATVVAWLSLFFVPVAHGPVVLAALLLALSQAGVSGGTAVYTVNQATVQYLLLPNRVLGRARATWRFMTWGTGPFGGLLAGVLGGTIGLRSTLLLAAVGQGFALVWLWASPLRTLMVFPPSADAALDADANEGQGSPVPSARPVARGN